MICVITKPIYGIPQAGRRLQRKVFPWCKDVMRLRQLDDSDDCVFVWDDPSGKEKFAVGIYVDNMQIVHSAELDSDGIALDSNSFYAKFMSQLRDDWDIVDEGPMTDLTCRSGPPRGGRRLGTVLGPTRVNLSREVAASSTLLPPARETGPHARSPPTRPYSRGPRREVPTALALTPAGCPRPPPSE